MRVPVALLLMLQFPAASRLTHALSLPFSRQLRAQPRSTSVRFAAAGNPYDFELVDLYGDAQLIYVANITVAGQSYEVSLHLRQVLISLMLVDRALQVQLDTGSADLWIDTKGMFLENVTNPGLSPYPMVYG